MKHSGKAMQAGLRLIIWSLLVVLGIYAVGLIAKYLHMMIAALAVVPLILWAGFTGFVFYFFRDPEARVPGEKAVVLAPAHGKVDVIEEHQENEYLKGPCQRISMFLSPLDVHVQRSPVDGTVSYVQHHAGKFLAATSSNCGLVNENVMMGFETPVAPGGRMAIRLIAGVVARRIIPWAQPGEAVARGERISIIQFGSRCDIYLPREMQITIQLGDRLVGGETIIARRK